MIWVPLPGRGGYRYRDTLRPLANRDLLESHGDALRRVEALSQEPLGDCLGEWRGHGPALSVYIQWAVYALRDRALITADESLQRLETIARLQQRNGLYPGCKGIHYGRSSGWEAPPWWATDIHAQHREKLISLWPERYSEELFAHGDRRD